MERRSREAFGGGECVTQVAIEHHSFSEFSHLLHSALLPYDGQPILVSKAVTGPLVWISRST
jgi:hypothetical protein